FSPWLFVRTVRLFFFFNDPATPEIYTLSLHDALPILADAQALGPQQVHDRVDALAVLQADFPVLFAAVDLVAALGQLVHRHLLPVRQANHEPAALAGQLGNAALADDLALLQDRHAVANLLDFTEQV